ncbi:MAG: TetR/AcrR family transcriptional regulator [Nocardioides sp.]|jgi:AcrR family transcriptional regulator
MPETTLTRRAELLRIAAHLFATKGYRNTTVRDIADAAGILSGSLYHHFPSKESMLDEILRTFQDQLFEEYDAILDASDDARTKLERGVRVSFAAIAEHHDEVAIFQNDSTFIASLDGFSYISERHEQSRDFWLRLLHEGVVSGVLRKDLDVDVVYRFLRDGIWFAVNWYRPDGSLTTAEVADRYSAMLLDGIATPAPPVVEEDAKRPSRNHAPARPAPPAG